MKATNIIIFETDQLDQNLKPPNVINGMELNDESKRTLIKTKWDQYAVEIDTGNIGMAY